MLANHMVRRSDCTLITVDHNVPSKDRTKLSPVEISILESNSQTQVLMMKENMRDFGLRYFGMSDKW